MEKIKVIINNNQKEVKIPTGLRMIVRRACIAVLRLENFNRSTQVSVSFVNNDEIRKLNAKYRGKDVETDVLSFQASENGNYDIDPETGFIMLIVSYEVEQDSSLALSDIGIYNSCLWKRRS